MSLGTLYASFDFRVECPTKEAFDFAVDRIDADELSNEICEYEEDEGVEVKAKQQGNKRFVTLKLWNTEVRTQIDDVLVELNTDLKEHGMHLEGGIRLEDEDGEHLRGDFSSDACKLDWESTDYFLGYTVEQIRQLQSIARNKWGRPKSL